MIAEDMGLKVIGYRSKEVVGYRRGIVGYGSKGFRDMGAEDYGIWEQGNCGI